MFREPIDANDPFIPVDTTILTKGDNIRFDLENTKTVFSVSLQYYEYHSIDNKLERIKVNTELNSDIYKDGRLKRSAVHIIKQDSAEKIIFDYNHSVKEVDKIYRLFNYFDQPFLWVPLLISIPFLLIFTYIKITGYIRYYGIKIVKTRNQNSTTEDND